MKFNSLFILILAATTPTACRAEPAAPLLPAPALESFKLTGTRAADARVTTVDAEQPEFKKALQIRTVTQPQRPYDIQLAARTTGPIAKGDVLLASFWMRTIESPMGEGFVGFTFEQALPDYKRSFGYETSAGTKWTKFDFPFRSAGAYAPGEAVMNLRFGYAPQAVEIGGASLLNYGTATPLESLPATRLTYTGSEPGAAWRAAAAARIEKFRKGELAITVQDAAGKPIPGAAVTVTQTRSAFAFGSAVNAKALISENPEDAKYRDMIKANFNRVVFENDLKWDQWKADRESPQKALAWLRAAGIETRGHCLVWPSWQHSPRALKPLAGDAPALRAAIADHITDEVGTLRGGPVDWDVINEPFKHHDFMDILGPSVQTEWFKAARAADPAAKLYLNDYGILESGGKDLAHQRHFEDTIAFLQQEKAPLDGIGIQGHFGSDLTSPPRMLEILDRLAKFGLPIQITEFDVQVPNENLQADFTRDFLTTMFSHPSVNGVVMWGFWEGRHYAPGAALWRKDWTPKPNAKVWQDLTQKQWRTDVTATSAADGSVKTRGFLGDYKVTVTAGGKTATETVTLGAAGKALMVKVG